MKNDLFFRKTWRKLFFLFLVISGTASAQVTITGKVSDASGNSLPGISVQVVKSNAGAASDPQGNYTLTTALKPGSYTVEFSGVGFKSSRLPLTVGSASSYSLNATLAEDALGLDEVIVTGTTQGTTKKELGSFISSLKAEDINKGAAGNVLQALQGKTPGAQVTQNSGDPAGGLSVRLRGISSITSSSEPLYIVDGVIVNNATNRVTNTASNYDGNNFIGSVGQNRMVDINPADIERIEVLNGAAAAAIYGSRANAGVVQIFTKRGKSGAPQVSFSVSGMVSELRKKIEVNQSPTKFGPSFLTQDLIATGRKLGFPDTLATLVTPTTRYDYQDYIFRTAVGTDNNLSVSGGNEKTKYYVSGSYFYNQGIIRNTDFQRYNFRANVDQTFNKWISATLGLNYINSSANEKPDGNSFFSPMNSVTILTNIHDIFTRDGNGNLLAVGERGRVNPVSVIEDIKQRQTTSRVISNLGLKLKPFRNLSIDYTMGIDNYTQLGTTLIPPFAYFVGEGTFGAGTASDASRNGYSSTSNNNFFAINHDLNATYSADITGALASTTQVGFSQQYEKNNYSLLQGRGLAPFVETVNAAATILPGADERSELSISGAFLQQNFKYKNHFFVTGAVRLDGSSVFAEDNRSQVYLKGSASYVLSSADYWQKLGVSGWWDYLKFRLAYGESGNLTGSGAFARFNTYSEATFVVMSVLNGSTVLANPYVMPERQQE
ncbi:MAG: SusC/RagA family TonB-linked outer membrane protein, partial [Chitinophagaceae bacterium]|nr:SusC/RagA family TonB-linked outer membrane protein [Chitinophagaceae bacterium]